MRKLLMIAAATGAVCALALPAAAQRHDPAYEQGYADAARDYANAARDFDPYYGEYPERVALGAPIDPYGETTTERHPLAGTNNFSTDGTSKVGGWTEQGPHTSWGMAVGKAAGGSTGGVYSTGP
jgi:hypothetical protein